MGGLKEQVGSLVGSKDLESSGAQQKTKGDAEVRLTLFLSRSSLMVEKT